MSKILSVLGALALLLAFAGSARPDDDDTDARAVVTKAIQAAGGEANLAKHKATSWKETGTYYGMGDGLPYTGKYSVQWPSQFRMEIEGIFTIVLNGDQGWIKSAQETKEMTKEELAQQMIGHRAGWIASLLPLKDKAFQLKVLDDAAVDKAPARGIQVTRKDYPDVKLYFDKTSNLLVKSAFRTKAPELQFKEVTMEVYYSNYRPVEGAKVPHKLVMNRDGKVFVEAEITELRAVGKLDAKVFAKPAD